MNQRSLPREFDQGHGERRRMVNPALGTYKRGMLVAAQTCCVEHCGNAATHGAWCELCFEEYTALNEIWARDEVKKADPAYRARVARRWRFVNGVVFFASFELLVGYCIESPRIWQTFVLGLGCALVFGVGNALLGGKAAKVKGNG